MQVRIACFGRAAASRPFDDAVDLDELTDDIEETADILRPYGKVAAWIAEGNVLHLLRRWQ